MYNIRNAIVSDSVALVKIIPQIDEETPYMKRSHGEFTLSIKEEERIIQDIINDSERAMFVAEYDGVIIGSLGISRNKLKKYTHTSSFGMGILKEFWGLGIGSKLIDHAIEWATFKGIRRMCLEVVSTNERAINLYVKKGFRVEGILENHIKIDGKYFDVIIMAKKI